jgi:hypothetical protein
MSEKPARRKFLAAAATAGAAFAAGAAAEPRVSFAHRTPSSHELVRVGVVLGRFTHTKNIWYAYTNPSAGTPRRMIFLLSAPSGVPAHVGAPIHTIRGEDEIG